MSLEKIANRCGIPKCHHLQCKMSCCEHAASRINGQLKVVVKHKHSILSMINNGQWIEALNLTYELLKHNLVNERRFEVFRIKYFSCKI